MAGFSEEAMDKEAEKREWLHFELPQTDATRK